MELRRSRSLPRRRTASSRIDETLFAPLFVQLDRNDHAEGAEGSDGVPWAEPLGSRIGGND